MRYSCSQSLHADNNKSIINKKMVDPSDSLFLGTFRLLIYRRTDFGDCVSLCPTPLFRTLVKWPAPCLQHFV